MGKDKAEAIEPTTIETKPAAVAAPVADSTVQFRSIIYAETGKGFETEEAAKAEFRQRRLDAATWGITRSQKDEGYCIMTFRMVVELRKRAEEEARATALANVKPMTYYHVHIGSSADSDKRDMLSIPVILNGLCTLLMLNSECILSEAQIEILENSRTENWIPLPNGGPDGKTFVKRGYKERVNWNKVRPATVEEFRDYQAKNSDKFAKFVAEQSKEKTDTVITM